ncbi:MAG: TatD family hydrolase [Cellvibrionaceae bacterium]|nr:TatD family hydrolase [Cellvibrionaceae bacterium]
MELIDSHCHLDFPEFSNVDQLWQQCQDHHISQLIIPATEPKQWPKIQALCNKLDGCYWAVGLHPWWVDEENFHALKNELEQALQDPNCIAIGECGLDGSKGITPLHIEALQWQLQQARERNLPVILHAHKAQQELLPMLKQQQPLRGVVHGYSGSIELAQNYIDQGMLIGIGGSISYPRAQKTRRMASELQLSKIVLETDAPSMPLFGKQGQSNSPLHLLEIAQCLADLRQQDIHHIAEQSSANSRALFGLK